jgi:Abortive infection alpha
MSGDKGKSVKETIADEVKGLAIEVYRDGAKPAVQEAGHVAGGIAKLLLWPVRKIVDGANNALERLSARVEKKLTGVPLDRLLLAPPTIAAPAAMHYAMLGDGDDVADLREMFENLLVNAMDAATASAAHPAFVAVISQMTPEDAWIAKSINQHDYAAAAVSEHGTQGKRSLGLYTLLGVEAVTDAAVRSRCISNLDRLGIIRITGETASDHSEYEEINKLVEADFPQDTWSHGQSIQVTPFGQQFLDTCVRVRRRG